jgi:hypothetical protein
MEERVNPFDHSLCLSINIHKFGTTRKVRPELVETDADKRLVKISKKIFDSNAMQQINMIDTQIRDYLKRYTIVNALMKPGIYLVPLDHVTTVEEFIRQKLEDRGYWIYQLGEEYEMVKEEFRQRLGSLYSEADYPSAGQVKAKFNITYEWLAMDVPQKLQYINRNIWLSEQEKAQQKIQVVAERIEQILTASMSELINHLIDRLTDREDGKRKKFASNMIERAREFFETFQAKNLIGSETLNELAARGKLLLDGIDVDSLRDQAKLRESVRQGFEQIREAMSSMVVTAPSRALQLEDDDSDSLF